MKCFKELHYSIGFPSMIFKNSLGSGESDPLAQPHSNAHLHIFVNYWRNFHKKFDKILKKLDNGDSATGTPFTSPLCWTSLLPRPLKIPWGANVIYLPKFEPFRNIIVSVAFPSLKIRL